MLLHFCQGDFNTRVDKDFENGRILELKDSKYQSSYKIGCILYYTF